MGPIRNSRWEQKRTDHEGYVIVYNIRRVWYKEPLRNSFRGKVRWNLLARLNSLATDVINSSAKH
jgi:hypothetical protein